MYRASAFLVSRSSVDPSCGRSSAALIAGHSIDVSSRGVFIDGQDVGGAIRTPLAGEAASVISAHPEVRRLMVSMQRDFARIHDTVAEGRDMGTVVFPDASLKVYVVADIAIRAVRRLRDEGTGEMGAMIRSMFLRDHRDRNRADSPLRLPPGALWLDGTRMSLTEQRDIILDAYRKRRASR